jgi:hypothetical protein
MRRSQASAAVVFGVAAACVGGLLTLVADLRCLGDSCRGSSNDSSAAVVTAVVTIVVVVAFAGLAHTGRGNWRWALLLTIALVGGYALASEVVFPAHPAH